MSVISIRVVNNIVTGSQTGAQVPPGNIEIDAAMAATLRALRQEAQSTHSSRQILWNNGSPALEDETRPTVQIKINGTTGNKRLDRGEVFSLQFNSQTSFGGNKVMELFDEFFLFDFTAGTSTRADMTIEKTGRYRLSHTDDYVLLNPLWVEVVR